MSQITKEVKNQIEKRRTFAIISHPDAGKTTLSEALLYETGKIRSLGRVDHHRHEKESQAHSEESEEGKESESLRQTSV